MDEKSKAAEAMQNTDDAGLDISPEALAELSNGKGEGDNE